MIPLILDFAEIPHLFSEVLAHKSYDYSQATPLSSSSHIRKNLNHVLNSIDLVVSVSNIDTNQSRVHAFLPPLHDSSNTGTLTQGFNATNVYNTVIHSPVLVADNWLSEQGSNLGNQVPSVQSFHSSPLTLPIPLPS